MDRDREHSRIPPEDRLRTITVVDVDVDVRDPPDAVREQPRDRDRRVVVHAESRRSGRHRVVETSGRVERVCHRAIEDRSRGRDGRAGYDRPGLVHLREDRVVAGPVPVAAVVSLCAVTGPRRRVDEVG